MPKRLIQISTAMVLMPTQTTNAVLTNTTARAATERAINGTEPCEYAVTTRPTSNPMVKLISSKC